MKRLYVDVGCKTVEIVYRGLNSLLDGNPILGASQGIYVENG